MLLFQFIRFGGNDVASLASLCAEVVEYWNDLAVNFGSHLPNVTSELRLVTPLEGQVFDDAMMRPRIAVLQLILDLRWWYCLFNIYCILVFFCSGVALGVGSIQFPDNYGLI